MSTTDGDDEATTLTAGHDAAARDALKECVQREKDRGLSPERQTTLRSLLKEYFDVFRLGWKEGDTPVSVKPLRVKLKPGAVPTACKQRRYSPLQTQFVEQFRADIVAHGLGYINPRSRWVGSFRKTVDQRGPNSCTKPMHWPMPVLEVVIARLLKKTAFSRSTGSRGTGSYRCTPLANMISLAHPDPAKTFTLFPDASHRSWGSVLTQIDPASADLPVGEQDHQRLAFLSGAFKGASLRWSTKEKEAYAIVASSKRLDYLLQRPGGFTICTDHRNLRYIFEQEP
jgi:hypothetical protein